MFNKISQFFEPEILNIFYPRFQVSWQFKRALYKHILSLLPAKPATRELPFSFEDTTEPWHPQASLMTQHHADKAWVSATPQQLEYLSIFCSVVSYSLWPHGLQYTRLPCLSLSSRVCSNSCPLSHWCHSTISSSVASFSSCPQSFPAPRSFPMSCLFYRIYKIVTICINEIFTKVWILLSFSPKLPAQCLAANRSKKNICSHVRKNVY